MKKKKKVSLTRVTLQEFTGKEKMGGKEGFVEDDGGVGKYAVTFHPDAKERLPLLSSPLLSSSPPPFSPHSKHT